MGQVLVVGSGNRKKLKELRVLLDDLPVALKLLSDFQNITEVVEDGRTFQENARKKALELAKQTGQLTIADDSGLTVDRLKGAPGVYSARYAGVEKDDQKNCDKLLAELRGVAYRKRTAQFRCAIAVARPEQVIKVIEDQVEGFITEKMMGDGGFGYDPLFFYPEFGTTFAQVPMEQKHSVSHRGKALRRMKAFLVHYLRESDF
jgi:XTP/dITP diphosphohydrolase